jgi:hypothetical protein
MQKFTIAFWSWTDRCPDYWHGQKQPLNERTAADANQTEVMAAYCHDQAADCSTFSYFCAPRDCSTPSASSLEEVNACALQVVNNACDAQKQPACYYAATGLDQRF